LDLVTTVRHSYYQLQIINASYAANLFGYILIKKISKSAPEQQSYYKKIKACSFFETKCTCNDLPYKKLPVSRRVRNGDAGNFVVVAAKREEHSKAH